MAAARAAGAAGLGYVLSTLSGSRMEDVRAASSGPVWYQLYLVGGHDVAKAAIARARAAGFSALVVTIDTPVAGLRERDFRNGTKELLSGRPLAMLPHVGQVLTRPRWLAGFMKDRGLMNFPNILLPDGPMAYADVGAALERSAVCWDDLHWIRQEWNGPMVIKGVHTSKTRGARWMPAHRRWWCRTTAAVNSMASPQRCEYCPKSWTRWAARRRS